MTVDGIPRDGRIAAANDGRGPAQGSNSSQRPSLAMLTATPSATHIGIDLDEQPETTFADQAAWSAQLDRVGFNGLTIAPDPVQVATEGAIWGSSKAHGFVCDAVVLSDDAGQFAVGRHALCWVHAERLVHKLDTFSTQTGPSP